MGGDSARQSESRDYALESSIVDRRPRLVDASRSRRARGIRGRIKTRARTMSCDFAKSRRGVRARGRVVGVSSPRARNDLMGVCGIKYVNVHFNQRVVIHRAVV